MKYYFAPLEGVTGYAFRLAHARYFSPADKYFTPFFSPTHTRQLTPRDIRELSAEHNRGICCVPQIMAKDAGDFLWAVEQLAGMGYREVNLNLGCPSGTVSAKGKGSGFLGKLSELDIFLEEVYSKTPVPISIKTRLGLAEPEEFLKILEIYNKYPIHELTIHPRVQKDFYKNTPRMDAFARAYAGSAAAVCYNGDLFAPEDVLALGERFPELPAVMLGRGAVRNPGMFGTLRGEPAPKRAALREFHDELFEAYCLDFGSVHNAMHRMKELWSYLIVQFPNSEKEIKRLRKSRTSADYSSAVDDIFRT